MTETNLQASKKIKIILADNRTLVRNCIANSIQQHAMNIEIVAEAPDGWHLLKLIASTECDIVLMDAILPGPSTLDIIKNIKVEFQNIAVLVSTSYSEMDFIIRCFKAGARGYFLNTGSMEHLIDIIKRVHRGETVIPPEVSKRITIKNLGHQPQMQLPHEVLTDREWEVMILMASGKALSRVAQALNLSPKTISTHRNNVMKKMGWQNNAEMMFYAIRKGLVKEEHPIQE
jgi:two-component system, NarL family, invasion response regulator UvrY